MLRMRIIGAVLGAVFALGLVTSAAAMAASTNNPQWESCDKKAGGKFTDAGCEKAGAGEFEASLLGAAEKREIQAEANGVQKLESTGLVIACKKFKLKEGSIKGSTAPAAGTSEQTIEYGGCEVEKQAKCEINKQKAGEAEIKTKPLKGELVFESKAAAEKEESKTLTLFTPTTGTAFAEFELTGECIVKGVIKVEGSVLAENKDGASHKETHEITAPAVPLKVYFRNNAKKTEEVKGVELKLSIGLKATYTGKGIIKLILSDFWWIFN